MGESAVRIGAVAGDCGRLLSEEEAIEILGLSGRENPVGSLRWLMRSRKLAYVTLGRGVYGYRRADLEAFIERCRVPAAGTGCGRFPLLRDAESI